MSSSNSFENVLYARAVCMLRECTAQIASEIVRFLLARASAAAKDPSQPLFDIPRPFRILWTIAVHLLTYLELVLLESVRLQNLAINLHMATKVTHD